MLRLFVLFITFPPKKSVRGDKWPGALFVYYILFFSRVGREGRAESASAGSHWESIANRLGIGGLGQKTNAGLV